MHCGRPFEAPPIREIALEWAQREGGGALITPVTGRPMVTDVGGLRSPGLGPLPAEERAEGGRKLLQVPS